MRLFVAIELHPRTAAELAQLGAELRARASRLAPAAKLTWVPVDRMHLTVRFIGEVDEGQAPRVREALAMPAAVAPFDLALTGLGVFPPSGRPRVLWVGLGAGREQVLALEREVSARLDACGIAGEARPYSPHLTLARVREGSGLRSRDWLADAATHTRVTPVEAITLFQSRLSPKGPTYIRLLQTPLRG